MRLLLIEGNPDDSSLLTHALFKEKGMEKEFEIVRANRLSQGLDLIARGDADVVLLDLFLPDSGGFETFQKIHAAAPHMPVVVLSRMDDERLGVRAVREGAQDYIVKGQITPKGLARAIRHAAERKRMENERKRMEANLRESEEKFRIVAETALDAIVSADSRGNIIYWNKSAERTFGYTVEEAMGKPLTLLMPERFHEAHRQGFQRFLSTGEARVVGRTVELEGRRKDGVEFPMELSLSSWSMGDGVFFTGILRDVTEHRWMMEGLKRMNEELGKQVAQKTQDYRMLARYLQSVREDERTALARTMHDELGQQLTGLKMDLSWIEKRLAEKKGVDGVGPVMEKIRTMSGMIDETVQSVRKISAELRPGILDDLGLVAAIEWQADQFQKRSGIACDYASNVSDVSLPPDQATAVFRVFQEVLTNVARHSDASKVEIRLKAEDERLLLEVRDNGKGVSMAELGHEEAFGVLGMRERAQFLGGEIQFTGVPEGGTEVILRIPYEGSHR